MPEDSKVPAHITSNPPTGGNTRRCAFCQDDLQAGESKQYRGELLCAECAKIALATHGSKKPTSRVAARAAEIDTCSMSNNRIAFVGIGSLVLVAASVIGSILVYQGTRDTWEPDNAAMIRMLADEAVQLDTTDQRAALAKYEELDRLVGRRQLRDVEIKQIVETARNRRGELETELAAELARERKEARRREQAEQEKRRRKEEARARQAQRRREEARRRAAAETLKANAYLMSQEFVKERLKAPSSARFPEYTSPDVVVSFDEGTRKYTVIAWVEAQNPFGVYLRSEYICRLWPEGGDLWRSDLTNLGSP